MTIDGALSKQPDPEQGNPPKPDWTREDVGKKLGKCDRRRISANFLHTERSISFDWLRFSANPQMDRHDKKPSEYNFM